jgi:hypothetical protein
LVNGGWAFPASSGPLFAGMIGAEKASLLLLSKVSVFQTMNLLLLKGMMGAESQSLAGN